MTATTSTTHGEPMLAGSTGMPYIALNVPQGRHCIEHTGTWVALKRYGIPLDGQPAEPMTVRGADGHDWYVWSADGIFVHARRERTAQEQEDYVDEMNSRVMLGFFSKDRQELVLRVGREIRSLASAVDPGRPLAPRRRRQLRRRLDAAASVLVALTCRRELSMREIRAAMADAGMPVAQPDYMARYDEEGN